MTNQELERRQKYDWSNPQCQDMVAHRLATNLDWCATAHADGRMPGWVFADIVLASQAEADLFGIWNRVCLALMAKGHRIFFTWLRKETAHA